VGHIYKAATQKCRNFTEAEQLAKEISQETFIRAFRLINNFTLKDDVPELEQSRLIKAWLGKIANYCFKKIYGKYIAVVVVERDMNEIDDVICPFCGDFLIEQKKVLECPKKHYKIKRGDLIASEPLTESVYDKDLFESLYESNDTEVTSEFRRKLQEAMNSLSDKEKHILLAYAHEGCLESKLHLSQSSLDELCKQYDTVSDTIKHIKQRAYVKVKKICFPTIKQIT